MLREVDLIACEDTRRTRALLSHFDIHTPTVSYFEHNKLTRGPQWPGWVGQQLGDLSRDLRADADRGHGVERAGGGDGGLHVAAGDGGEAVLRRLLGEGNLSHQDADESDDRDCGNGDERFLSHASLNVGGRREVSSNQ